MQCKIVCVSFKECISLHQPISLEWNKGGETSNSVKYTQSVAMQFENLSLSQQTNLRVVQFFSEQHFGNLLSLIKLQEK